MKYLSDERKKQLVQRLSNQAMRIHMLKTRHGHILPQVGAQMAQVQATCDNALAADSERLLATANKLARLWMTNGSPYDAVENEIEKLLTSLEKRTYPSRWIIDFKSPDPPIDGVLANSND